MRRFYAPKENFQKEKIVLSFEETRHLRDVLRLRESDQVRVFDGAGAEFLCRIEKIGKKETVLRIENAVAPTATESVLELTLAVALLKGEKFDWAVQKAVELGVSKLVPLVTQRCDVKVENAEKKTERWRKIALEAAKQSGRVRLMQVDGPMNFKKFIKAAEGIKLLFAERGGADFSAVEEAGKITAVTGAEGGWEDSEIEAARICGFQIITFGGRIMRAETAAVTVAAILQHRFGDLR